MEDFMTIKGNTRDFYKWRCPIQIPLQESTGSLSMRSMIGIQLSASPGSASAFKPRAAFSQGGAQCMTEQGSDTRAWPFPSNVRCFSSTLCSELLLLGWLRLHQVCIRSARLMDDFPGSINQSCPFAFLSTCVNLAINPFALTPSYCLLPGESSLQWKLFKIHLGKPQQTLGARVYPIAPTSLSSVFNFDFSGIF